MDRQVSVSIIIFVVIVAFHQFSYILIIFVVIVGIVWACYDDFPD